MIIPCMICKEENLGWLGDEEVEDVEGNPMWEGYYECRNCKTFVTISQKYKDME